MYFFSSWFVDLFSLRYLSASELMNYRGLSQYIWFSLYLLLYHLSIHTTFPSLHSPHSNAFFIPSCCEFKSWFLHFFLLQKKKKKVKSFPFHTNSLWLEFSPLVFPFISLSPFPCFLLFLKSLSVSSVFLSEGRVVVDGKWSRDRLWCNVNGCIE